MSAAGAAAVRAPARPAGRIQPLPGQRTTARQRPVEPRLRVVAPRVGRSRAKLAVLCVTMLGVGLVALLMLTIDLGSGAYTLTQLKQQQRELGEQRQDLAQQVEAMQAPQALERRAEKLGMVAAPNTTYLQLPDGKVVGKAAPAQAPPKAATGSGDATAAERREAAEQAAAGTASRAEQAKQRAKPDTTRTTTKKTAGTAKTGQKQRTAQR